MTRQRCESYERLAISDLECRAGSDGLWQYPTDRTAASVAGDHVRLIYAGVDLQIPLERTRCNYGGVRVWWRCPRCERRSGVLYGLTDDSNFGCRMCLKLSYESDTQDKYDRLGRKQRKLEERLGAFEVDWRGMGRWAFMAEKPKGMRWSTYDDIQSRIEVARRDALRFLLGKRL